MKKNPKLQITITGDYSALALSDTCLCTFVGLLCDEHVHNGADGASVVTAEGQIDAKVRRYHTAKISKRDQRGMQ